MTEIRQKYWEDVSEGEQLSPITLEVDYRRIILNVAATWDFMPAHHNPAYAKTMGRETIFLNTMFFEGFIERIGTEWAGPLSFVKRRKMQLTGAIYPDQHAYGTGQVTRKFIDGQSGLIDMSIEIANEGGLCCKGELTLRLPRRMPEDGVT